MMNSSSVLIRQFCYLQREMLLSNEMQCNLNLLISEKAAKLEVYHLKSQGIHLTKKFTLP